MGSSSPSSRDDGTIRSMPMMAITTFGSDVTRRPLPSLVTNEGNGRLVTSLPKVVIAIMGMERIVPSSRELGLLLPMLVASANGRAVTTYFSFVNGPRLPHELDGPDEVHVVV